MTYFNHLSETKATSSSFEVGREETSMVKIRALIDIVCRNDVWDHVGERIQDYIEPVYFIVFDSMSDNEDLGI